MRLIVIGRTGQVAQEIARRLPAGTTATFLSRADADLTDPAAAAAALSARIADADAIINAAAWTAVDRAEAEEDAARAVNADSPGAMARVAADRAVPFIHISTDYVFDGSGDRPWRPDDPPAPLSAYGRTKLAGEEAVRAAGGPHVILRTSWVFSAHGTNFLRTMLRLGAERPELRVVDDQTGGPTPAAAIADATLTLAAHLRDGAPGGTFHVAGAPDTTWAGFARAIMAAARLPATVTGIPTSAYPTPARRPANSRLDCTTLTATHGIARPDWRAALPGIIKDLA